MEKVIPYEQALKLYSGSDLSFEADLVAHLKRGYVVCTPEAFALARPIRRDCLPVQLQNPFYVEQLENADCWFIWLLTGKLEVAAKWLPCPLPWLGFARRGGKAKFVRAERLLKSV